VFQFYASQTTYGTRLQEEISNCVLSFGEYSHAYAITIHNAKGLTVSLAVTAFKLSEQFVNQSYAVLLRARRLTDIIFEDDQLFFKRFTDYSFMRQAAILLQEYMRLGIYPIL
jgi:hypothetical protein